MRLLRCFPRSVLLLALLVIRTGIMAPTGQAQSKSIGTADDTSPINNRYALVVGISNYTGNGLKSLQSCEPDAYAMYNFLQRRECWSLTPAHIRLLTNEKATRSNIDNALSFLLSQVQDPATATFYFYFSGHGAYGTFLPHDAVATDAKTFLSYAWLRGRLEAKGIHSKVFFLDACQAGSALAVKSAAEKEAFEAMFKSPSHPNYICFAAVQSDQLAAASSRFDKPYSLYTQELLIGLGALGEQDADQAQGQAADGLITASELNSFLQNRLQLAQPPVYAGTDETFPLALSARYAAPLRPTALTVKDEQLYEQGKLAYDAQKYADAFAYFSQAAAVGSAAAMNSLGDCYYYGQGVKQDYDEAVRWFSRAVDANDVAAMSNLGFCYYYNKGVGRDYAEAVNWFRQAAAKGNADGMSHLGVCYGDGLGVKQDNAEAVRWYHRAAAAGSANGMNHLGDCYYQGLGVKQDKVEAVRWYRQAAAKGSSRAADTLRRLGL